MITGGQITFSRKLVPAQYESKEASMTLSFEGVGDADRATELARHYVLNALGLIESRPSLTSETKQEVEERLPPTTESVLPQSTAPSTVASMESVKVPEWTEANVRTLLTNKVQKLLPEHKERASVLVMECVRAFCPTDPPRATLIPEDKRAAFVTALEGLK